MIKPHLTSLDSLYILHALDLMHPQSDQSYLCMPPNNLKGQLLLKRSAPNSQGRRLSLWLNPYEPLYLSGTCARYLPSFAAGP
jgi:hypothetical protein